MTGFGIIGHAQNLVTYQKADVDFVLDSLPIIANMSRVAARAKEHGLNFKLLDGFSAETSGGLLICLGSENAVKLCQESLAGGFEAWIIGRVISGSKQAKIADDVKVIEVNSFS